MSFPGSSSKQAVKLPSPFKLQDKCSEVVGSCKGLICISDIPNSMAVYNPSTRRFRNIPVCSDAVGHCNPRYCVNLGFGYDSVGDGYKILRVDQYQNFDIPETEARVFSCKADSWKKIENFPFPICFPRVDGMFVSGALHWSYTANYGTSKPVVDMIGAFDIHDEKYYTVPMPGCWDTEQNMGFFKLGVSGGKLLVMDSCLWKFQTWVMKEYGKKESWTTLLHFKSSEINSMYSTPLLYSEEKSLFLVENPVTNRYFWYDLRSQKFKKARILGLNGNFEFLTGFPHPFGAKLCVESLDWCGGGGQVS